MIAALFPQPLEVDEALSLAQIEPSPTGARSASAAARPSGSIRRRAGQQPRAARARRADRRDGRRGQARLLDDGARPIRPRQDDPVRDALPGGGGRLRRPGSPDCTGRVVADGPTTEIKAMVGSRTIRATLPTCRSSGSSTFRASPAPSAGRGSRPRLRGLGCLAARPAARVPGSPRHRTSSPAALKPLLAKAKGGKLDPAEEETLRAHYLQTVCKTTRPPSTQLDTLARLTKERAAVDAEVAATRWSCRRWPSPATRS